MTLYARLGGEAAVFAAVDGLYRRLVADPKLQPFFEGVDVAVQSDKMVGFLARAFGGPDAMHGRDLRAAHSKLVARGLGDAHFDAVLAHLEATLIDLRLEDGAVREVLGIAASTRSAVLGRHDG